MSGAEKLHAFPYKYLKGPIPLEELQQGPTEGNCRLAVQDYFYTVHGLFLGREEIVLPEAYRNTGKIVSDFKGDVVVFFKDLQVGDIIYAEKLRDRKERMFRHQRNSYPTEDEWLISLHMGIYFGIPTDDLLSRMPTDGQIDREKPAVWHASFIAGGTALWTVDKFCHYYQPVVAKRLLT